MKLSTLIISSAVLSLAASLQAALQYTFENASMEDWTLVTTPGGSVTGYASSNANNGGRTYGQAGSGSYMLIPTPFGGRDSSHNTIVFRSPEFQLYEAGDLSFYLLGGMGGQASPGDSFDALPTSSSSSGFLGLALRRASDGAYLLSGRRSSSQQGSSWQQISWTEAEIATATAGDAPDERYTLDLIDSFSGGWGWVVLDTVTIPGDVPMVVNAPSFGDDRYEMSAGKVGTLYSASIADLATDGDGDPIEYYLVDGPNWLSVDADGHLSGTPTLSHVGVNEFIVGVTDNDEGQDTAVISIEVTSRASLSRALQPGKNGALKFGVVPDTQGNTNGVPVPETAAITEQLLMHQPNFVIHVGDVTDGNVSGDSKLGQLEVFNTYMTAPLQQAGILVYPVRGNHDTNAYRKTSRNVSAWEEAFPYLFTGEAAVVDPTNVPGGSTINPNEDNFSFVFNPSQDVWLVALDMWNGGSNVNYSHWMDSQFDAIRLQSPDAHIFAYSHSGLFSLSTHAAMVEYIGSPSDFIESGIAYNIDGWFSGHNHIYDRSMVMNDGEPQFFNMTTGSASYKFYGLTRSPVSSQHVNSLVDSTSYTRRPIAFEMVYVNGPFVTLETYMCVNNGDGFKDWYMADRYIYSLNGRQFSIGQDDSYNDQSIVDSAPAGEGYIGTTISITNGVNHDNRVYLQSGERFEGYRNISTGWWKQEEWYEDDTAHLASDIVSVHGMEYEPENQLTDTYTLALGYNGVAFSAHEDELALITFIDFDPDDDAPGSWVNAVEAILDIDGSSEPVMRAALDSDPVGTWGIDTESNTVWARLDYEGDFAIARVPKGADLDKDGLPDSWEEEMLGSLEYDGDSDPDDDGLDNAGEYFAGTEPTIKDTDGDLVNDLAEINQGLDPTTTNLDLAESLLQNLYGSLNEQVALQYYRKDAAGGLRAQPAVMTLQDGFQVNLKLEESDDMSSWSTIDNVNGGTQPLGLDTSVFYLWQISIR